MYTNNGTNYTNGLSVNPHFDKERARKRIISSSILLGIGVLAAYIGFILLVLASAFMPTPYYYTNDICIEPAPPQYTYNTNIYEYFYSNSGGYFYTESSWWSSIPYYYDGNGNCYKYDYYTREYCDQATGYSYRNYSLGIYESYYGSNGYYNEGNRFFYHGSGSFCYDNLGTTIYFDSYGNYYYYKSGSIFGYNKAGDYYYNEYDGIYALDEKGSFFLKPGRFDFRAPEPDEVFHDNYGNYYRLDEQGFYYCDSYGNPTYYYDDNSYYCIEPHYNNDYNAMMSVGTILLIGGLGLTILESILLSRAVKAFKASKRALRQAHGYSPYGTPAAARPAPAARRSFCTCCGTKADSDAAYCVNCGHRL